METSKLSTEQKARRKKNLQFIKLMKQYSKYNDEFLLKALEKEGLTMDDLKRLENSNKADT